MIVNLNLYLSLPYIYEEYNYRVTLIQVFTKAIYEYIYISMTQHINNYLVELIKVTSSASCDQAIESIKDILIITKIYKQRNYQE